MKHIEKIVENFRLFWGIAPPDSLKGKKGKDIEDFLRQSHTTYIQNLIQRVERERQEIPPFREDRKTISRDELLMRTAINSTLDTIISLIKEM
jgi:hypothetical protein